MARGPERLRNTLSRFPRDPSRAFWTEGFDPQTCRLTLQWYFVTDIRYEKGTEPNPVPQTFLFPDAVGVWMSRDISCYEVSIDPFNTEPCPPDRPYWSPHTYVTRTATCRSRVSRLLTDSELRHVVGRDKDRMTEWPERRKAEHVWFSDFRYHTKHFHMIRLPLRQWKP